MPKNKDLVIEVSPDNLRTVALAAISGVRSMAAPALLARAASRGDVSGLRATPFAFLGDDRASALLQTLMVGEMIGDKTPVIPSRVSAGPLFGRALSGTLVGSALFASRGRQTLAGALRGAASALAGVYAADRRRSATTQGLGLPDPLFGLLEDGLILVGGARLLRKGLASGG
ncbi:MAG TPA: DUF4126 family protein [Rubrobacter sp.]|nr:DUF4126 family protein [Rubrobacter sp.]